MSAAGAPPDALLVLGFVGLMDEELVTFLILLSSASGGAPAADTGALAVGDKVIVNGPAYYAGNGGRRTALLCFG